MSAIHPAAAAAITAPTYTTGGQPHPFAFELGNPLHDAGAQTTNGAPVVPAQSLSSISEAI